MASDSNPHPNVLFIQFQLLYTYFFTLWVIKFGRVLMADKTLCDLTLASRSSHKINPTIAASQIGAYFPHWSRSSIFRIGATTWGSHERLRLLLTSLFANVICGVCHHGLKVIAPASEIVSSFWGGIKEGGGNGKGLIVSSIWASLFFTRKKNSLPRRPIQQAPLSFHWPGKVK